METGVLLKNVWKTGVLAGMFLWSSLVNQGMAAGLSDEAQPLQLTAEAVNKMPVADRTEYAAKFWRLDAEDLAGLPKNYRSTEQRNLRFQGKPLTEKGLAELKASGSAQMSEQEMAALLTKLKGYTAGPVYDIDLRQETHGFFNGQAVSAYGKRDWGNIGRSYDEILQEEKGRVLSEQGKSVRVWQLDKKKEPVPLSGPELLVNTAKTEETIATEQGWQYFRITATDHIMTAPENIDRFIYLYKHLPKDAWLHFHCEAGLGRTTTYLLIYDILRNGRTLPLETLATRQVALGGKDLLGLVKKKAKKNEKKESWHEAYQKERAFWLRSFYQYVKENPDLQISWSVWLGMHREALHFQ